MRPETVWGRDSSPVSCAPAHPRAPPVGRCALPAATAPGTAPCNPGWAWAVPATAVWAAGWVCLWHPQGQVAPCPPSASALCPVSAAASPCSRANSQDAPPRPGESAGGKGRRQQEAPRPALVPSLPYYVPPDGGDGPRPPRPGPGLHSCPPRSPAGGTVTLAGSGVRREVGESRAGAERTGVQLPSTVHVGALLPSSLEDSGALCCPDGPGEPRSRPHLTHGLYAASHPFILPSYDRHVKTAYTWVARRDVLLPRQAS